MSSSSAAKGALGVGGAEASTLDEQEERFVSSYVEQALAGWQGKLSARDLAWMRERLTESARTNPELARLARAACPRDVDQSAEVVRQPRKS